MPPTATRCAKCEATFERKHNRQKYCPTCREGGCSVCKRKDGSHSASCSRGGTEAGKLPRKAARGRPRRATPVTAVAVPDARDGAKALLREHLLEEKVQLQAQLAVVDRMIERVGE